ncbi:MAG: NUDIX domain-containing protein [Cyclobacteriaceae bacterium]|nr:NUDIX domain-containing protein [Cyclobacteriaceae bacterium]
MDKNIETLFGNRLRVRVCGLCWKGDSLLLINHSLYPGQAFWSPPGGGIEVGQSKEECLEREFLEETGLAIKVLAFRFVAEFIKPPLHAIELFADVAAIGGNLMVGTDPEMMGNNQIIRSVQYLSWKTIQGIPAHEKHGILTHCKSIKELKTLTGFCRI